MQLSTSVVRVIIFIFLISQEACVILVTMSDEFLIKYVICWEEIPRVNCHKYLVARLEIRIQITQLL